MGTDVAVAIAPSAPSQAKMRSVPEDSSQPLPQLAQDVTVGTDRSVRSGAAAAVLGAPYQDIPSVMFAHEQRMLKSEDVIMTKHQPAVSGNCHSLFMVCDGHQGAGAAQHVCEYIPWILGRTLPKELPDWADAAEVARYAEVVRRAISCAVVLADNRWTATAQLAGTTMTLAVVSGWLVTIANTGDSSAVLDTGDHVCEITLSHRIQHNPDEQARLRAGGAELAPLGFHLQGPAKPKEMGVGPLRLWPGGLCVSRSIGDMDAGPLVVPLPHVRQMLVPPDRALRLLLASDGLWDLMPFDRAAKCVRNKLPHEAAAFLAAAAVRDRRMSDDVSLIVVDVLPEVGVMFPVSALRSGASITPKPSSGGGLFACFKPPPPPSPRVVAGGPVQLLADVDCLEAYPMHTHNLTRASMDMSAASFKGTLRRPSDLTVHGSKAHVFSSDKSWHSTTTSNGGSAHGGANHTVHGAAGGGGASSAGNSRHGAPAPRGVESAHGGSVYRGGGPPSRDGSAHGGGAARPVGPPAADGGALGGGGGIAAADGLAPVRTYTLPPGEEAAAPFLRSSSDARESGEGRVRGGAAGHCCDGGGGRGQVLAHTVSAFLERPDAFAAPPPRTRSAVADDGTAAGLMRLIGSAPADADHALLQSSLAADEATSSEDNAGLGGSGGPRRSGSLERSGSRTLPPLLEANAHTGTLEPTAAVAVAVPSAAVAVPAPRQQRPKSPPPYMGDGI